MNDSDTAGELRTEAADALVVVRNTCWACGEVLEKRVARRHQGHGHFSWQCDRCEVGWSGPGTAA
jgi:hypothetical protein